MSSSSYILPRHQAVHETSNYCILVRSGVLVIFFFSIPFIPLLFHCSRLSFRFPGVKFTLLGVAFSFCISLKHFGTNILCSARSAMGFTSYHTMFLASPE
ncbi:hypothetical protein C8J57DRAFT_1374687 [Mycena rebaudengoi]|nr:hypothetical protein C8J57DRAFT_1374687 [Mycena rebaudengoi]